MIFIGGNIPSKFPLMDKSNKSLYIGVNLGRTKWLISRSLNPHRNRITSHLQSMSKYLNLYSSKFDKYNNFRRFQCNFGQTFNVKNLVKESTFFEIEKNISSIDLIFTNKITRFQNP